jgi:undecaprenyl diphosphate synthase
MASKFQGFAIDPGRLPRHIGIIMDGNGRWAKLRGLDRTKGHRAGSRSVRAVVKACRSIGIPYLTLFAFSAQNWGRPADEVQALMELLEEFIIKEWQEIMKRDIRVVQLGERRRVPTHVRRRLTELIRATRGNKSMTLSLALSYGSREEIAGAARKLCRRVERGKLTSAEVDVASFTRALYTHGQPDPDLIIRTGGEKRISNFLLWQGAYAEYLFSPKLWPDFNRRDLLAAIADFQKRRRRFGLTDEQIDKRGVDGA